MRKTLSFIFLLGLVSLRGQGQELLTRTIIVDSVALDPGVDPLDLRVFSIFDVRPDQIITLVQDSMFHTGNKPLVCRATYRRGNDLVLNLILDDKGGHIEMRHLEAAPDTLRIPLWHIYKNQLIDGISRSVAYYHHIDDSLVKKPFAEKSWQSPAIYVHQDTMREIPVIINGKNYVVPVTVAQPHSIVKVVDGYLSRQDERKERKVFTSPELKRRKLKYNTYSTTIRTTFHSYSGTLDMKK